MCQLHNVAYDDDEDNEKAIETTFNLSVSHLINITFNSFFSVLLRACVNELMIKAYSTVN